MNLANSLNINIASPLLFCSVSPWSNGTKSYVIKYLNATYGSCKIDIRNSHRVVCQTLIQIKEKRSTSGYTLCFFVFLSGMTFVMKVFRMEERHIEHKTGNGSLFISLDKCSRENQLRMFLLIFQLTFRISRIEASESETFYVMGSQIIYFDFELKTAKVISNATHAVQFKMIS